MTKSKINPRKATIQIGIGGFTILLGLLSIFMQNSVATSLILIIIGGGCMSLGYRNS